MPLYSLYDRLKPEFKGALLENKNDSEYTEMYKRIKKWLSSTCMYDDLTLHQLQCIYTFCSVDYFGLKPIDIMYGDAVFYTNDEYDKIVKSLKEIVDNS